MLSGSQDMVDYDSEGLALLGSPGTRKSPMGYAARLRERAERYSLLAESLCDPKIIAVVQDCIRELEAEAAQQEQKRF